MLTPPPLLDDFLHQEWLREVRDLLTLTTTATLDFPNTGAGLTSDLMVTLRGVVANDIILLGPPSTIEAGLTWVGFVSANDTVTVRIMVSTAIAVNPASGLWRVSALKY